jgi:hypothetical protein
LIREIGDFREIDFSVVGIGEEAGKGGASGFAQRSGSPLDSPCRSERRVIGALGECRVFAQANQFANGFRCSKSNADCCLKSFAESRLLKLKGLPIDFQSFFVILFARFLIPLVF